MIRKLRQNELSSVIQIWLDGNLEAHSFIPAEYWQKNIENVRKLMMTSEIYVYETEDDHKVVGFIGLIDNFIGGLFVHTSFRSSGVGQELINYVKLYKTYLVVHVYKKNEFGQKFYMREDFKLTREQMDNNTGELEYEMIWEK